MANPNIALTSNLKRITSGNVPTTITLPVGHMAFGMINGSPVLYGNPNGTIQVFGENMTWTDILATSTAAAIRTDLDVYSRAEIGTMLSATFRFRGTVPVVGDLPTTNNATGDVWQVDADGKFRAWDGTAWVLLGAFVDLSDYYTAAQVDALLAAINTAITTIQGDITSINTSITNINNTLNDSSTGLAARVTALETGLDDLETELENEITRVEGLIPTVSLVIGEI